jgi:lipoate---protein ligase
VTALRLLDLGGVSGLRSQALYHALCYSVSEGMPPTLAVLYPTQPYACIGYHRALDAEIDQAFCESHAIPVYRRRVGGGAVYLDPDQIFFQLVLPAHTVRGTISDVYTELLGPAVAAYRALGVADADLCGVNDVAVHRRKLSGTGMARIADAVVLVGNIMVDFPVTTMARVLKLPDEFARAWVEASMRRWVSSVHRETQRRPSYAEVANALLRAFGDWAGGAVGPSDLTSSEDAHITRAEARLSSADWIHAEGQATRIHPPDAVRRVKIRAERYDAFFDSDLAGETIRAYVSSEDGIVEAVHLHSDDCGSLRLRQALRELSVSLAGWPSDQLTRLVRESLAAVPHAREEEICCLADRLATAARADD